MLLTWEFTFDEMLKYKRNLTKLEHALEDIKNGCKKFESSVNQLNAIKKKVLNFERRNNDGGTKLKHPTKGINLQYYTISQQLDDNFKNMRKGLESMGSALRDFLKDAVNITIMTIAVQQPPGSPLRFYGEQKMKEEVKNQFELMRYVLADPKCFFNEQIKAMKKDPLYYLTLLSLPVASGGFYKSVKTPKVTKKFHIKQN